MSAIPKALPPLTAAPSYQQPLAQAHLATGKQTSPRAEMLHTQAPDSFTTLPTVMVVQASPSEKKSNASLPWKGILSGLAIAGSVAAAGFVAFNARARQIFMDVVPMAFGWIVSEAIFGAVVRGIMSIFE
jgi:hypothetical protein